MVDQDLGQFTAILDAVCALLSRGQYTPNDMNTALWWRALRAYPLADVIAAFDAHVCDDQRGRFVPVPADILAQLRQRAADDGRPGPEEAWAIALEARDQDATVVWTAEIAAAWNVARQVLALRDEVGARMAFREKYVALVAAARAGGHTIEWQASLGLDKRGVADALQLAEAAGRQWRKAGIGTTGAEDALALPPPVGGEVLLLSGPSAAEPAFERLAALAREMATPKPYEPSAGAVAIAETTQAKRAQAARVAAYASEHGISLAANPGRAGRRARRAGRLPLPKPFTEAEPV